MDHDSHDSSALDTAARTAIDALVPHLGPEARVGVLSGAGISAASGIPTFRGDDGLWKNARAEDLATPEGFAADPELVWEWYGWRRDRIRAASPNAAHHALVELARRVASLDVLTQNVDGLHAAALAAIHDPPPMPVVELHGSIWRLRCTGCGREAEDQRPGPAPGELPTCECGALLRPAVVWFGESLDPDALERAADAAIRSDVFLVVGTSALVYPAASYGAIARQHGAYVVEFNLEATGTTGGGAGAVHAPAEVALPALVERIDRERGVQ